MGSWKNDRIGSAEKGENPTVMVKMKSGFAVIEFSTSMCNICYNYPCIDSKM